MYIHLCICTYIHVCIQKYLVLNTNPKHTFFKVQRINACFILRCVLFLISEKLLTPISKNENKPLQTLPSLAKPAAALQTFNSAILTPVSNNNTGFLRNLLNSSGGKVYEKLCFTGLSWYQA